MPLIRDLNLNYSKWDGVGNDEDEDLCAAPLQRDPMGFKSSMRRLEKQRDADRHALIADVSVDIEKERARREGTRTTPGATCWTCHGRDATLRCGRCKMVYFCNKECQRNGWKGHKFQCRETTEDEAKRQRERHEYEEMLSRRAKEEQLEYPPDEVGPVTKMLREKSSGSTFKKPPMKYDGSMRVAVVIPFRQQQPLQDRGSHLQRLVPLLHTILSNLVKTSNLKSWKIVVVEQAEDGRAFNRGAVLNAGFHFLDNSGEEYDQVILHDADLLAKDDNTKMWYGVDVPKGFIVHLTAEGYPKHNGQNKTPGAARGVVVARWDDFKESNGFPLDVWGWAQCMEDRIWADRLGAKKMRYYQCPIGSWEDLDRVDLRNCPQATEDPYRWYDPKYVDFSKPEGQLVAPTNENGRQAAGPAILQTMTREQKLKALADRTGGLDTINYKVIEQDTKFVHSTLVKVLLLDAHGPHR